jgi:hypothetical protein
MIGPLVRLVRTHKVVTMWRVLTLLTSLGAGLAHSCFLLQDHLHPKPFSFVGHPPAPKGPALPWMASGDRPAARRKILMPTSLSQGL